MDTFTVPSDQSEPVRLWCAENAPTAAFGAGTVTLNEVDSFFFQLRWFPGCKLAGDGW